MPRNELGRSLTENRGLDALSVVAVISPSLVRLLMIVTGTLNRTGAAAERFAWWGIVVGMLLIAFILWSRGEGPSSIGLGRPASWPQSYSAQTAPSRSSSPAVGCPSRFWFQSDWRCTGVASMLRARWRPWSERRLFSSITLRS